MFPSEGREMLEVLLFNLHAFVLEGFYRLGQIHCIPVNNGRYHEIESTGSIALIFVRAIAYLAQAVGEDRARSDFEQAVDLARATEDRQEEWQSLMGLIWLLSEHDDQVRSDFFQRLLDLAQSLEDPQKYALGKNLQAHHLAYAGQPEASIPMHEEALHLFQQQGDQRGEARALEFLGQTMAFYGDMRG